MKHIHHPVIVYLFISLLSLSCAVALFMLGGSLAEITGNEKTLKGFTFKASGGIAGFLLIFFVSYKALISLDKNLKDRNPGLNAIKKELLETIYQPDFLLLMTNEFKEMAWKNVTRSINKSFFTHINDEIGNIIYKNFIPQQLDHYHKECEAYYDIQETENKSHVKIVESLKYKVISSSKKITLDLFEMVEGLIDDKSDIKIKKLIINGKDYSSRIPVPEITLDKERGFKKIKLDFKLEVDENCDEYSIEKEVESIHTKQLNIFWRRDIQKYTYEFQIEIQDNKELEIDLVPFGQVIDFKSIGKEIVNTLKKHYGLLVPGDGYIIFVK